jgi:electron transport complex protein RnfG
MRRLWKLPLVLAVICAVAAGALTWVNAMTRPVIEARLAQAKVAALGSVLPEADRFEDRTEAVRALGEDFDGVREGYLGTLDGQPVGMVFLVAGQGYGGIVEVLVGVNPAGRITRLVVLSAPGETPGLGSRITEDWFTAQFADMGDIFPLEFGTGPGQVQSITGATVSSRSVVASANLALRAFRLLWEH